MMATESGIYASRGRNDRASFDRITLRSRWPRGVIYDLESTSDDGFLLLTGQHDQSIAFVSKYDSNGTWDRNFGTDGVVQAPDSQNWRFERVMLKEAGNRFFLVESKWSDEEESNVVLVKCYLADGRLDDSFGNQGEFQASTQEAGVSALAYDEQSGALYVMMRPSSTTGSRLVVWRIDQSGHFDQGFGAGGAAQVDFPQAATLTLAEAWVQEVSGENRLLLTLTASVAGKEHVGFTRLSVKGELDKTFGTDGWRIQQSDGRWGGTFLDPQQSLKYVEKSDEVVKVYGLTQDGEGPELTFESPEKVGNDRRWNAPISQLADGGYRIIHASIDQAGGSTRPGYVYRVNDSGDLDVDFGQEGRFKLESDFAWTIVVPKIALARNGIDLLVWVGDSVYGIKG